MNCNIKRIIAVTAAFALFLLPLTGCCSVTTDTEGLFSESPSTGSHSKEPMSDHTEPIVAEQEQEETKAPQKETSDSGKQPAPETSFAEASSSSGAELPAVSQSEEHSILPEQENTHPNTDKPQVETSRPVPETSSAASREPVSKEEPSKEAVKPLDPKDQLILLADALKRTQYYKSEIVGTVKAGSLYTQNIHDVHIMCGKEAYLRAVSTSSLVDVGKEAFFSGNRVVTRDADNVDQNQWSKNFSVVSLNAYQATDGNTPWELSNYILNKDTVLKASVERNGNGTWVLKADIDPKKGTVRYAAKMKNYGGLSANPVFSSCKIEITFDADNHISTLKSFDTYQIKKGILKLNCTSSLTESFVYTRNVSIPNVQTFRDQL